MPSQNDDNNLSDGMPFSDESMDKVREQLSREDLETDAKYKPTTWGSGNVSGLEDLTMPSGQIILAKRPGISGLIKAGVLYDVDQLSAIVSEKHLIRVADKPIQVNGKSVMKDKKAMEGILHVMDKIVSYVVVKPHVEMAPNDVTLRKNGVIYTDTIDMEDRLFIMQYAIGGTRDVERFRRESSILVGGMESVENMEQASE